jgi:hypothetical protein
MKGIRKLTEGFENSESLEKYSKTENGARRYNVTDCHFELCDPQRSKVCYSSNEV